MTKNLYTNRRHLRIMVLIYGAAFALIVSVAVMVRAHDQNNRDDFVLGLSLSLIFLVALGGLEFFARRLVYALEQTSAGVVLITKGVRGRTRVGKVHSIGAEVHQHTDDYNNRHHKLSAGSPRKTYILDVTKDPEFAAKLRRLL